jgi:predicted MFS family arabinose efflux permease
MYAGSFIGAFGMPAMTNLTLEQVPESRGTMMSINNVLTSLGASIGGVVGGVSLALFGYTGMFFTFAALILIAVAIYFFLTKDPCTTMQTKLK